MLTWKLRDQTVNLASSVAVVAVSCALASFAAGAPQSYAARRLGLVLALRLGLTLATHALLVPPSTPRGAQPWSRAVFRMLRVQYLMLVGNMGGDGLGVLAGWCAARSRIGRPTESPDPPCLPFFLKVSLGLQLPLTLHLVAAGVELGAAAVNGSRVGGWCGVSGGGVRGRARGSRGASEGDAHARDTLPPPPSHHLPPPFP